MQSDKVELESNWVQPNHIEEDNDGLQTTRPVEVTYPFKAHPNNAPGIIKDNSLPVDNAKVSR